MDQKKLQRYFRNQSDLEEIEEVLEWFQTDEGSRYLEARLNRDMVRYAEEEKLLLYPNGPSDVLFERIEQSRTGRSYRRVRYDWFSRVATFLIVCTLSLTAYWLGKTVESTEEKLAQTVQPIQWKSIQTLENQQQLVTLGDGTRIRLNGETTLTVPEIFGSDERVVYLDGEAYFEVASESERPFMIQAGEMWIEVLGTAFNVRMDRMSDQIQVAVTEGRVSMSGEDHGRGREAILTKDSFGLYDLATGGILIEKTRVQNYLSWMNGEFFFYDEPLSQVARTLERIYGVDVHFESEALRGVHLSADFARNNLTEVLDVITETLGLSYQLNQDERRVVIES